jgi:DNA-binding NtrC family response regulator
MSQVILIADDDPTQRRLLQGVVEGFGYQVRVATSGEEVLNLVAAPAQPDIDLLLLDLAMPGQDGMSVLKALKPVHPNLPVIVLTAQGGIDTVVNAMKAGADDFIVKPASPERLQVSISNALKLTALTGELTRLSKRISGTLTFADLIAKSGGMGQVIRLGQRAAKSAIPILIEGESGVGKELIARAIQGESERAGKPFVTVNCGAIPEQLVESILFGHERGAFTGAKDKHTGKFQEANGGTLFLDEIGELPLDMQVKLLRALQEGEIDPVGARRPVRVDVRIISATNRNLTQLAEEGRFREDLYYRLNVFPIHVPPLRERREDIPELIGHFVARFAAEEGKTVTGIEPHTLEMLLAYPWPGNVRQLENTIFRGVVLCDRPFLTQEDFPQISGLSHHYPAGDAEAGPLPIPVSSPGLPAQPAPPGEHMDDAVSFAPASQMPQTGASPLHPPHAFVERLHHFDRPHAQSAQGEIAATDGAGHLRPLHEIESEVIRLALEHYRGHMSEVARRLGIGRSTLYRKVRELGLDKQAVER